MIPCYRISLRVLAEDKLYTTIVIWKKLRNKLGKNPRNDLGSWEHLMQNVESNVEDDALVAFSLS